MLMECHDDSPDLYSNFWDQFPFVDKNLIDTILKALICSKFLPIFINKRILFYIQNETELDGKAYKLYRGKLIMLRKIFNNSSLKQLNKQCC